MDILVGTSNPSKVDFFKQVLNSPSIILHTPKELVITGEPEENGQTPEENALLKARFYGQYAENVICADSGLYFTELPLTDLRQPGLHVRTPKGHPSRLEDEEMIAWYASLVHTLGGHVTAYYLDGMGLKIGEKYFGFSATREEAMQTAFTMVDVPYPARRAGWPLDSLSLAKDGCPFLAPDRVRDAQQQWGYKARMNEFFREKLKL